MSMDLSRYCTERRSPAISAASTALHSGRAFEVSRQSALLDELQVASSRVLSSSSEILDGAGTAWPAAQRRAGQRREAGESSAMSGSQGSSSALCIRKKRPQRSASPDAPSWTVLQRAAIASTRLGAGSCGLKVHRWLPQRSRSGAVCSRQLSDHQSKSADIYGALDGAPLAQGPRPLQRPLPWPLLACLFGCLLAMWQYAFDASRLRRCRSCFRQPYSLLKPTEAATSIATLTVVHETSVDPFAVFSAASALQTPAQRDERQNIKSHQPARPTAKQRRQHQQAQAPAGRNSGSNRPQPQRAHIGHMAVPSGASGSAAVLPPQQPQKPQKNTDGDVGGDGGRQRKPYVVSKPREAWTEAEHALFVEALKL